MKNAFLGGLLESIVESFPWFDEGDGVKMMKVQVCAARFATVGLFLLSKARRGGCHILCDIE